MLSSAHPHPSTATATLLTEAGTPPAPGCGNALVAALAARKIPDIPTAAPAAWARNCRRVLLGRGRLMQSSLRMAVSGQPPIIAVDREQTKAVTNTLVKSLGLTMVN